MITADTQPELVIVTDPPNCYYCRVLEEELKLIPEVVEKYTVHRVGPDYAIKHGITGLPTVIVFEDKKEVQRNVGLLRGGKLREFLRRR